MPFALSTRLSSYIAVILQYLWRVELGTHEGIDGIIHPYIQG